MTKDSRNSENLSIGTRSRSGSRSRSNSRGRQTLKANNNGIMVEFDADKDVIDSKIKIFTRIRPSSATNRQSLKISQSGNNVVVQQGDKTLNFLCDQVFGESSTQEEVYDSIAKGLLDKFVDGCNVCVFAYGQTGSGKTYSILGPHSDPGILLRFSRDLFDRSMGWLKHMDVFIEISFFELYLEKVYDLFAKERTPLRVRGGDVPYVENLSRRTVGSYAELVELLESGVAKRASAATLINDLSSRSHAIFQIIFRRNKVEVVNDVTKENVVLSNCYFVDLAGSERLDMAGFGNKTETANINCSLLALQKVIDAKSANSFFVNYRESVLTRLLKECFGGNSITHLLATISPELQYTGLSIGTLRFASKAALVRQSPRLNIDPFITAVKDLKAENDEMKAELAKLRSQKNSVGESSVSSGLKSFEFPCIIELFADSSLNVWKKLGAERVKFFMLADERPSFECWTLCGGSFLKALNDNVFLNGKLLLNDAEMALTHMDRIVLNGMRFFIFCNNNDVKGMPYFENVKLEYVEATFSIIQRKLRDEARKEFEEDKAELFRQINMERSAAQRELEALRSKLKLGNVCETTNDGTSDEQAELLLSSVAEATEIKRNLQDVDNDSLFCSWNGLEDCEKMEYVEMGSCVSTANNLLTNFKKRDLFAFKLVENSQREVEPVSVRLMNLKRRTFTDLNSCEFKSVYEQLVELYQRSASIYDNVNEVDAILYGGNWEWRKSAPGRRSNILNTALYNSVCNVAKSRRSSVDQIQQSFVKRKSGIVDVLDRAINSTKRSNVSVLMSQLRLLRMNIDETRNANEELTIIHNLLNWITELDVSLNEAWRLVEKCYCSSEPQAVSAIGAESIENIAVRNIYSFIIAVESLKRSICALSATSSASVEHIIDDMRHFFTMIETNKNRWIYAVSEKSETASFFVVTINKQIPFFYTLVGRLAFFYGQPFPSDDKTHSNEIRSKFSDGVLISVREACSEMDDLYEMYRNNSTIPDSKLMGILCDCIKEICDVSIKHFHTETVFYTLRQLTFIRNLLIANNVDLDEVQKKLKSVLEMNTRLLQLGSRPECRPLYLLGKNIGQYVSRCIDQVEESRNDRSSRLHLTRQ